ncbi:MAG: PGPGW domain-containing protein [Acidobacteriota bacterium]
MPIEDTSTEDIQRTRLSKTTMLKRLLLLTSGFVLLLVGLAGLVLPGIQGVLTLAIGTALLSTVSPTVRSWLRALFSGWPRGWRRYLRVERRLQQILGV